MKIRVLSGQSWLDLAVQICGSMESAFSMAQENGMEVTDELAAGQIVTCMQEYIRNQDIVNYYERNNIIPATASEVHTGVFDKTFDDTFG